MPAPPQLNTLIDRFERNLDAYRSGKYNETQVRRDFIDPLLKLLGWDVDNEKGYAEQYREVVHEDAVKVSGSTKAPDYSLRIGGQRKLFVEAKKPAVNIKQDIAPAFQVRRYAWSAKLPLSILTDFEEFAVYDCRNKPDKSDKASHGRIMYFTFRDYAEKWDELLALFSPEAIMQGAFDKFVHSSKKKRGTAEVDDAFLAEISTWRDALARNIALRNPGIKTRDLNHAVQRTIDRLIFLRIAEDRGIEGYGRLRDTTQQADIYQKIGRLFQLADAKYNSGLFHFKPEKGRDNASLDSFTLNLTIDDKPLRDIIKRLYYPDSPYQFDVIPADILGQVYEQFLGKVIRLTPKGQAKVEEKPEVKKAGGVFYTPTYIVDYIVQQTVGKLLEGKKPGPKGNASKLRILDPACGSGSFLLGAYQFLLDWHRSQYLKTPDKWARGKNPAIYQNDRGDWQLTIGERKRILLNNIYGVDIDPQAVEVTKLSLLLKVMEGETEQTLGSQLRLLPERVLPDLSHNIQCGNSLIGPDFYDGQMSLGIVDEEEMYRINVFDWATAFPNIVPWGGFDAVIGNPPYIRIQAMKQWAPKEVEFYKQAYQSASKGNYDIYVVFVEKGLQLLNRNGVLGFILPHKFFNAKYGEPLRKIISEGQNISNIVHFGHQQIFENATTYTCLLFLNSGQNGAFNFTKTNNLLDWKLNPKVSGEVPASEVTKNEWNFVPGKAGNLFRRLKSIDHKLEDVTDRIFQGLKTGADKVFIVEAIEISSNKIKVFSKHLNDSFWLESNLLHPLIKGGDSKKYSLSETKRKIIFPYANNSQQKTELILKKHMVSNYPLTWGYLKRCKHDLELRDRGGMKGENWYAFSRNQALEIIQSPKMFTPDIAPISSFSFDGKGDVFFTGGVSGGYGILVKSQHAREFIFGLLNSRLLDWYNKQIATVMRGGYYSYESRFIKHWPIQLGDQVTQNSIASLVEQMLELHKRLTAAQTAHEKNLLQRQIITTDRQIDQLVYRLYNLTPEEIAIVENQT